MDKQCRRTDLPLSRDPSFFQIGRLTIVVIPLVWVSAGTIHTCPLGFSGSDERIALAIWILINLLRCRSLSLCPRPFPSLPHLNWRLGPLPWIGLDPSSSTADVDLMMRYAYQTPKLNSRKIPAIASLVFRSSLAILFVMSRFKSQFALFG